MNIFYLFFSEDVLKLLGFVSWFWFVWFFVFFYWVQSIPLQKINKLQQQVELGIQRNKRKSLLIHFLFWGILPSRLSSPWHYYVSRYPKGPSYLIRPSCWKHFNNSDYWLHV